LFVCLFVNKSASGKIMRLTTDNISEDGNHDSSSIVETKTQKFLPLSPYLILTSGTVTALTHNPKNLTNIRYFDASNSATQYDKATHSRSVLVYVFTTPLQVDRCYPRWCTCMWKPNKSLRGVTCDTLRKEQ